VTQPTTLPEVTRVDRSVGAVVQRRIDGTFDVDPWGLDPDLVSLVGRLVPSVTVRTTGGGRLPDGPALCLWRGDGLGVVPLVVGLGAASTRPVRFCGVPDLGPLRAVAGRLGGVGGHPADLRGLLRAGNLVAVRLDTAHRPDEEALAGLGWAGEDVGRGTSSDPTVQEWLPDEAVEAAIEVGAPVVPVAVGTPRPWSPLARVAVGTPVPTRTRLAARSLAEVAEGVAAAFRSLG
jgi:hypothetical protein